jgi:hypothetical protein
VAIQTATQKSLAQITTGRFVAGLGVGALSGESIYVLKVANPFLMSSYSYRSVSTMGTFPNLGKV